MKKLRFIIISTIYFLLPTSLVHAQSTSLSLSPPVIEVLIAPTKAASETFTLKTSGEDISIIPQLHKATPSDQNGHVTIDPQPLNPDSIPLRVTIPGKQFGQPIKVTGDTLPLTISLEAAATEETQDIYLALVLRAVSSESPQESSVTSPAISALILATINPSGVIPIDIEIDQFSPPFLHDSWSPLTITGSLKNNVGTMIRPEGKYEIVTPTGKTTFSQSLYPNLILGHSSRSILGQVKDQPPTPLTWSPSWKNIGPYRLRLTITTQGGTKLTEVEKVVWILPIKIIVTGSLLIIVLTFITLAFSRKMLQ